MYKYQKKRTSFKNKKNYSKFSKFGRRYPLYASPMSKINGSLGVYDGAYLAKCSDTLDVPAGAAGQRDMVFTWGDLTPGVGYGTPLSMQEFRLFGTGDNPPFKQFRIVGLKMTLNLVTQVAIASPNNTYVGFVGVEVASFTSENVGGVVLPPQAIEKQADYKNYCGKQCVSIYRDVGSFWKKSGEPVWADCQNGVIFYKPASTLMRLTTIGFTANQVVARLNVDYYVEFRGINI